MFAVTKWSDFFSSALKTGTTATTAADSCPPDTCEIHQVYRTQPRPSCDPKIFVNLYDHSPNFDYGII